MVSFTMLRTRMVDNQLRPQSVTDLGILAVMGEVPREHFVPPEARPLAYIDHDIRIKPPTAETPARYMMPPAPFARMLQAAAIAHTDIVLDVGCGSGYSAAVLARLANSVVALEADPELAERASVALMEAGVGNVAVVTGPLAEGYPSEGPYDVIFVNGGVGAHARGAASPVEGRRAAGGAGRVGRVRVGHALHAQRRRGGGPARLQCGGPAAAGLQQAGGLRFLKRINANACCGILIAAPAFSG